MYIAYKKYLKIQTLLGLCATISTILLLIVAFYQNFGSEKNILKLGGNYWMAIFILSILGWLIGVGLSLIFKVPKSSVVSIGILTSNQNSVLAGTIILLSFEKDEDGDEGIG